MADTSRDDKNKTDRRLDLHLTPQLDLSGTAQAAMNDDEKAQARILHFLRVRTRLTIIFERLWLRLLPFLLLVALFAIFAWSGLFSVMPRWLHQASLWAFAFAGAAAIGLLFTLRKPSNTEIDRRIEEVNGLEHMPLSVQSQKLAVGTADPMAQMLWHEHQKRMAARLRHLQSGLPRPRISRYDPYALRTLVLLSFITAFAFSHSLSSKRLADAFILKPAALAVAPRIDAWVTPPRYTGKAPVFLNHGSEKLAAITVPQGSLLSVRIAGGTAAHLQISDRAGARWDVNPVQTDDSAQRAADQSAGAQTFEYELQTPSDVTLSTGGFENSWSFDVTPDRSPTIRFSKKPEQARNGTLQLHYEITDDYAPAKAWAEIESPQADDLETLPLFDAPNIPLTLPRRNTKAAMTATDLTAHPWAGSQVRMTLVVEDEAGHQGRSETITTTLPERVFTNPLARAVIEQRRILAMDSLQRDHVLDMLSAIMIRPKESIGSIAHFLGLRSVRTRLDLAYTEEQLRDVVNAMWNVARGIEDGKLSDAEQRLRQAQEAMRNALQNGASDEEIARLSQELREAMQNYLREFASRNPQNNAGQQPSANAKVLTERDLQKLMDQIETLARQGVRDQAQQLLSQLENLMNNLQTGQNSRQSQQGQQGQGGSGQQGQMNRLGDLMRRQQQLMNETFKLDQQMQRQFGDNEEEFDENQSADGQAGNNQPQSEETMRKLQSEQQQLQSQLQALTDALTEMGIEPSGDFNDAMRSMDKAAQSLGHADSGQANDAQGQALEALRRGGRDMMKKMQEAMGEQNGGQGQGNTQRDPLGRQQGSSGPDFGDDSVKLPGEIDLQRAREILEDIRRRLGNRLSPQAEKDYLERLLKFD